MYNMAPTHFYITYAGNKRNETKFILPYLPLDSIKRVVEPNCGSCAISLAIYRTHPNLEFVLNDINPYLFEMFEILRDKTQTERLQNELNELLPALKNSRELYKEITTSKTLLGWIIANKFYNIRPGLYPQGKVWNSIDLEKYEIVNFFRNANIKFTTMTDIETFILYKDNSDTLIIFDPPYLSSNNDLYSDRRNCNIYEYLHRNDINSVNAYVMLVLEDIWIMNLLFPKEKYNSIEYGKRYEMSKKQTTHTIIMNRRFSP